jgi:hypothetical protein
MARRRNPLVRRRLAQVLADLGPSLDRDGRLRLADVLDRVGATAKYGLLARTCAEAAATLRNEQPAGDVTG